MVRPSRDFISIPRSPCSTAPLHMKFGPKENEQPKTNYSSDCKHGYATGSSESRTHESLTYVLLSHLYANIFYGL